MNVGDRPYAVENATVEKQLLNTWMVHHKPDPNPNPNPIPHPNPIPYPTPFFTATATATPTPTPTPTPIPCPTPTPDSTPKPTPKVGVTEFLVPLLEHYKVLICEPCHHSNTPPPASPDVLG